MKVVLKSRWIPEVISGICAQILSCDLQVRELVKVRRPRRCPTRDLHSPGDVEVMAGLAGQTVRVPFAHRHKANFILRGEGRDLHERLD